MKFEKVRLYLSPPRIGRFLSATGSKTRAVKLYKANLKISQSFLPVLAVLEVTLRNRINAILSYHFADPDWIINQKTGFMVHSSLTYYTHNGRPIQNHYLKKQVEKVEQKIRNAGVPMTSGKVISEQAFGFWTEMFERNYYRILEGRPIQIFTHLPPLHGRSKVSDRLNKIRLFRNRLYHNEPVCFSGNSISFQKCEDAYQLTRDILAWCDPELLPWIRDIDFISRRISSAKKI